jgi:hypothetical protein
MATFSSLSPTNRAHVALALAATEGLATAAVLAVPDAPDEHAVASELVDTAMAAHRRSELRQTASRMGLTVGTSPLTR